MFKRWLPNKLCVFTGSSCVFSIPVDIPGHQAPPQTQGHSPNLKDKSLESQLHVFTGARGKRGKGSRKQEGIVDKSKSLRILAVAVLGGWGIWIYI